MNIFIKHENMFEYVVGLRWRLKHFEVLGVSIQVWLSYDFPVPVFLQDSESRAGLSWMQGAAVVSGCRCLRLAWNKNRLWRGPNLVKISRGRIEESTLKSQIFWDKGVKILKPLALIYHLLYVLPRKVWMIVQR